MLTFEEAQSALTEFADHLPEPIYRELNGGILLLPEAVPHPKSVNGDLWIMGQYHYEPRGFGRYITIYYGSLQRTCGHLSKERQIQRLREVLYHELTHHLEHLAGDKSLDLQDAQDMSRYLREHGQ